MRRHTSRLALVVLTAMSLGACHRVPPLERLVETEGTTADTAESQQDFKTLEERFSYAYGVDLAEKFKEEGIELNVELLMDGMRAVLGGAELKMPTDEVAATLKLYEEVHLQRKEQERAVAAEKNQRESEIFLAANAKQDGVVVTKSGLQYKVLVAGKGDYRPTIEDEITVNYRGRLIDGTEFDSTYKRNQPYSAKAKQLIQGWTEALQLMTEGAKWELYVPAELGYGENGSHPYIGPNAALIFEVELLGIEKYQPPE